MTYKWIDNNPISEQTNTDYPKQTTMAEQSHLHRLSGHVNGLVIDGYNVYPNPANGLQNIDLARAQPKKKRIDRSQRHQ